MSESEFRLSGVMILRSPGSCGECADIYFREDGENFGNDLWDVLLYNKQGFMLKPLEEVHVELVIRKTPAPDSGS